jgi:predicted glutamine amidotransferase
MCGIASALLFQSSKRTPSHSRKVQIIFNEIMAETLGRGKHATGISLCGYRDATTGSETNRKEYFGVLKGPYDCDDFMYTEGEENPSGQTYQKMLKLWRDMGPNLTAAIGHCRWKTQGDEYDNLNNHPICVPAKGASIVGVHNGCVDNDHILFRDIPIERDGLVDSEAIFKVLHYLGMGSEPSLEILDEALKYIEGKYAIVGYATKFPHLVFTTKFQKPLEFAVCEDLDAIFIASETKFIKDAFARFNRIALSTGWNTVKYDTYTNIENDGYLFDTTKPLKEKDENNKGHGIHKYVCVEKKALSRTIYTDFKVTKTSVTDLTKTTTTPGRTNVPATTPAPAVPATRGWGGSSFNRNTGVQNQNLSAKTDAEKEEECIKTNPKIIDESDRDKEALVQTTVGAEIINRNDDKKDAKFLTEPGILLDEVVDKVKQRAKDLDKEIMKESDGDPTTNLGNVLDAIDELRKTKELDSGAIDVIKNTFKTVVCETVDYTVNQIITELISEMSVVESELVALLEGGENDGDVVRAYKKTLDKEITKRRRAQERIRKLTELFAGMLICRSFNARKSDKLAEFIDKNMPDESEERRKDMFQLLSRTSTDVDRKEAIISLKEILKEKEEDGG